MTCGRISQEEWVRAIEDDDVLKEVIKYVVSGWPVKGTVSDLVENYRGITDELSIADGVIFRSDQLVVPKTLRQRVIDLGHEGHIGMSATKRRVRLEYW